MSKKQIQGNYEYKTWLSNIKGVMFSGIFTNYTVLQREPYHSSLYGICDTPSTNITLNIKNELNGLIEIYSTISMDNGNWKIILPKIYSNGGNYTLTVSCIECGNSFNKSQQSIYYVTFGDVFFCSGQSNMQLEMHFTFNHKYTYSNITNLNKYSNIRFYTKQELVTNDTAYVIPINNNNKEYRWHISNKDNINQIDLFSATCWYFAQNLIDKFNHTDINFGLIDSSVGGSQIEAWMMENTPLLCTDIEYPCSECVNGGLYKGMVAPFINMTIKGILWYQGENNLLEGSNSKRGNHDMGGNWIHNTGYSCLQKQMISQWRSIWSIMPNTTVEYVPFGIVSLAAGTSEGNKKEMASFRWSQSMNYGILPNDEIPNTFIAMGYDIGDPFGTNSLPIDNQYPAPYNWNETQWFMGTIHPRSKWYVGNRLAHNANRFIYNNDYIWQGPLMIGCDLDIYANIINIYFNQTMLYNEKIIIQKFNLWYNNTLSNNVKHWNTFQLLIGNKWEYIDDNQLFIDNNGYNIMINISSYAFNDNINNINGIRYAWNDAPCCGDLDTNKHPCPMNSCPIITSISHLPAIPFNAQIINNTCKCYQPQTCDYAFEMDAIMSSMDTTRDLLYSSASSFVPMDNDWIPYLPQYVCIRSTTNTNQSIKDLNEFIGGYQRNESIINLINNNTFWTKPINDDTNQLTHLYYNQSLDLWEIGSLFNSENNLICMDNLSYYSPEYCDIWYYKKYDLIIELTIYTEWCTEYDIVRQSEINQHVSMPSSHAPSITSILLIIMLILVVCVIFCVIIRKYHHYIVNKKEKGIIIGLDMFNEIGAADNIEERALI